MFEITAILAASVTVLTSQVKISRSVGQFFPLFKMDASVTSRFSCYNFTFANSTVQTIWLQRTDNLDELYGIDGYVTVVVKPDDVNQCEVTSDSGPVKFASISGASFVDSFILMGHSTGLEMANSSDLFRCKATRMEDSEATGMDFQLSYGLTGTFMDGSSLQPYIYLFNSTCIYQKFIDFPADSDALELPAGTFNFLTSYNAKNLSSNYTMLCIGESVDRCVNVSCPYTATIQRGNKVFQSKSIVHGYNDNYTRWETIDLDVADSLESIYLIQQQCVRFRASTGRSVVVKGPDDPTQPSMVLDLFRIQLRHLDKKTYKTAKFLSGWICAEDLAIFPTTALTEKDKALARYCRRAQGADPGEVDALIYTSIEQACKNVIFLQGYTRVMIMLVCVLCAVFQVVSIYAKRDYKRKNAVQKRRLKMKLATLFLDALALVVIGTAYSSGTALLCVPPMVLWFVELFWEACDSAEFERGEIVTNMFKEVFTCKKFRFADISQILLLWLINLFFGVADAVLLMADICQFLDFMKLDMEFVESSPLLAPSNMLTKLADDLLTAFPGASFIMMLVFFVLLQIIMTLLRSNFTWVKVMQRKWKRLHTQGKPPKYADDATAERLVGEAKQSKGIIDWGLVGLVVPIRLLSLYQNFLQLMLGESYMFMFYQGETGGPGAAEVFLMVFVSSYFYMLTKFNMFISWLTGVYILVMQVFLNLIIIGTRISQAAVSVLLAVLTAPFFSMLNPTGVSFSQVVHHSISAALVAVSQFIFTVLEVASFFLYPMFIMFSDFLPPFDFALTALGIVPPQVRIVENANRMHVENAIESVMRVCICCCAYWLIGIFTITQQDVDVWKKSAIFAVFFLIIPFVRYQYDGQRATNQLISQRMALPDLRENVYNRVLQAYNGMVDSVLNFKLKYNAHQYLQKISADYEHPESSFGDLLINQMLICYGFVPVIGPIIGIFANFMNEPSLQQAGKTELTAAFFMNILHFMTILIAMLLMVWSTGSGYIVFIVFYFILSAVDALDQTSEIVEGAGRISLISLMPCLKGCVGKCKVKQETNKKMMEEERRAVQEMEALRLQQIRLKSRTNSARASKPAIDVSAPKEREEPSGKKGLVPATPGDRLE